MSTLSTLIPARPTTFQLVAAASNSLRPWSTSVDGKPTEVGDDCFQFVGGLACDFIDVDSAVAEDGGGLGVHLVGDEDARLSLPGLLPQNRASARSASISAVSTVAPHQMRSPWRSVAIGADVVGDVLGLEQFHHRFLADLVGLAIGPIGELQADRRVRTARRVGGEMFVQGADLTQRDRAAALASARAISAKTPGRFPPNRARKPTRPPASRRLIVSPRKMPSISRPLFVRRKIFGSGRGGPPSSRSTARTGRSSRGRPRRSSVFAG